MMAIDSSRARKIAFTVTLTVLLSPPAHTTTEYKTFLLFLSFFFIWFFVVVVVRFRRLCQPEILQFVKLNEDIIKRTINEWTKQAANEKWKKIMENVNDEKFNVTANSLSPLLSADHFNLVNFLENLHKNSFYFYFSFRSLSAYVCVVIVLVKFCILSPSSNLLLFFLYSCQLVKQASNKMHWMEELTWWLMQNFSIETLKSDFKFFLFSAYWKQPQIHRFVYTYVFVIFPRYFFRFLTCE